MANALNTKSILRWSAETTYGLVDGTPTMSNIPFISGESLKGEETIEPSNVISSDRVKKGARRTVEGMSGSIPTPLRFSDFDDWLGYVLFDASWSSEVSVASSDACTITASTGTFAIDTDTWSSTPTVGSIVKVAGSSNSETNTYYKVATASSSEFTVDNKADLTDESGVSLTIDELAQVTNGTTLTTLDIEREHTDITKFEMYSGVGLESLSLDIPESGRITCAWDFIGQQEEANDATVGDGSPNSTSTNKDMIAGDVVYLMDAYADLAFQSMSLDISNGLDPELNPGSVNPDDLNYSQWLEISGSINAYFPDHTIKDKFLAGTSSNLLFAIEDPDGNAYIIDLPEIQYTDESSQSGSESGKIISPLSFDAYEHTSESASIRIAKYSA